MRQFAVQRAFREPCGEFAFNEDPNAFDLNNLLLLALERALAPPIVHRRSVYQPMRVIVVDPELFTRDGAIAQMNCEIPHLLPRALPTDPRVTSHPSNLYQREVRGEILSDESGRLYEKLGRQIRPIHQLASGPFGEVIDLVPAAAQSHLRPMPQSARSNLAESNEGANASSAVEETMAANCEPGQSRFVPLTQTTATTSTVSHRKLFADPGQWRVVWWGEFKEILARQLAHPERLRDTYRLPCYVQVIETERTVSVEELAVLYKSNKEHDPGLYFLTGEIAAKLDLVLPLRPAPPQNALRTPNTLFANERVFRLLAANDPTADIATVRNKLQSSSQVEVSGAKIKNLQCGIERLSREAIPNHFVKEWEFKVSREEALYDMNTKPTLGSRIKNFLQRLRPLKLRGEFRKWQALLTEKNVDEQLWAVHPPSGMLTHPLVREWATKTLELAGYDSQRMIREWEIFWRRKGL